MKYTKTHWITISSMVAAVLGLVGLDVYMIANDVQGDTVSAIMVEGGTRLAFLPYVFGALAGHLFVKQQRDIEPVLAYGVLPALGLLVSVINWAIPSYWFTPLVALAIGTVNSLVFWPNKGAAGS